MNPRVIAVEALPNYHLKLTFANRERKVFDASPYLQIGIFTELVDQNLFFQVKAFNGSVVWPNDLDFDPDTLYLDSQPIDS
ncbi:DUF2442 domain-containing protein [Rudanella lutea]|uniref:DUF2442 domain-containing protein n=1 Tax=Rudanella lutea TaxID=451374 RepID=UPI0003784B89|nr:DUF2442 domain-containing protein [Rudanella lutea]